MSQVLKTVGGVPLPRHTCAPRSERARGFATVFTQPDDDGDPPVWHHQLLVDDGNPGSRSQPIAISFCPFCGVKLAREHFT